MRLKRSEPRKLTGMTKLAKAIRFAAKLHREQFREGEPQLPYITHPVDVINKLAYIGRVTDEDILCAAALHDVLEETEADIEKIEDKFGERVATLVKELTREEPTEKVSKSLSEDALRDLRNTLLLAGVKKMSPEARSVKLADRLSNLQAAEQTRTGEKLERYRAQSRDILKIIPRETSPALWDAIDGMLQTKEEPVVMTVAAS